MPLAAQVTIATHTASASVYALKRTRFGSKGQPDAKKVLVEASALSRLKHPNVIHYYASFSEDSTVCILMEVRAIAWPAAAATLCPFSRCGGVGRGCSALQSTARTALHAVG